jgi:hypothetical protein
MRMHLTFTLNFGIFPPENLLVEGKDRFINGEVTKYRHEPQVRMSFIRNNNLELIDLRVSTEKDGYVDNDHVIFFFLEIKIYEKSRIDDCR